MKVPGEGKGVLSSVTELTKAPSPPSFLLAAGKQASESFSRVTGLGGESTQPISLRLHLSRTLTELHEKLSKGE
ncbi:hypothetical protein WN943_006677 [Citrus x changshan-huyou]